METKGYVLDKQGGIMVGSEGILFYKQIIQTKKVVIGYHNKKVTKERFIFLGYKDDNIKAKFGLIYLINLRGV